MFSISTWHLRFINNSDMDRIINVYSSFLPAIDSIEVICFIHLPFLKELQLFGKYFKVYVFYLIKLFISFFITLIHCFFYGNLKLKINLQSYLIEFYYQI